MDMQFKIPVVSFCTLVEHQFHECQLFAVLTEGRVFVTGKLVYELELPREGKKCLKGYFMFFFTFMYAYCSYSFPVWWPVLFVFVFKSLAKNLE